MKKIISVIFVLAFTVIAGLSFVACGGGKSGEDVFKLFESEIAMLLGEGSPFVTDTRNDVSSKFMLDKFKKKADDFTFVDYGWQDELIALGLNYIDKFYPLAKECKVYANTASMELSLTQLTEGFNKLKHEFANTFKISQSESAEIYNGFIASYGDEATHFADDVYNCAFELQKYLSGVAKIDADFAGQEASQTAVEFYMQSRWLEIYQDYNVLVMHNCKTDILAVPSYVLQLQSKTIDQNISIEIREKIQLYFNALANERELTATALSRFSYYDYVRQHNRDVAAYEKVLPHAEEYLKQINRYFLDTSFISPPNFIAQACNFAEENIFA